MSESFKQFESLADQLRAWVNTRVAQVKLSVAEKVSKLAATMMALLLSALVFFLFLVLITVSASLLIGDWLGHMWLGFLIMAFVVLLLGWIIWAARERLLRLPMLNAFIKALFEEEEEGDEKD